MFRHPIIISAFLFLFFTGAALCAPTGSLPPGMNSFAVLTEALWDLDEEISHDAAANEVFLSRLSALISRHDKGLCPPDLEALLNDVDTLMNDILSTKKELAEIEEKIAADEKLLEKARKRGKSDDADKILARISNLAARRGNLENTAPVLSQGFTEKLAGLVEPYQETTCPEDAILIEGTYCIDKYEYPNKKGARPALNITYNRAAAMCAAQGKRLCSGTEWMRACAGPVCRPNRKALIPFDPAECSAGLDKFPGASPSPSGAAPVCDTTEGVADMYGNAWEWTDEDYSSRHKVVRGGSHPGDRAAGCASSAWSDPSTTRPHFGFRCCADPAPREQWQPAPETELTAPEHATDTVNM